MRRWILLAVASVLLLLAAAPAAIVWWVAYTEEGLQFAVARIPEKLGRVELRIRGVRGTLAHGLHLDSLEISHERVDLRLAPVDGRLSLLPLAWQTIASPELSIGEAVVRVKPRLRPPPKTPLRFLPLGLRARADRLRVAKATVIAPSGRATEFTDLSAAGVATSRRISLFEVTGTVFGITATGSGRLGAADPLKIAADLRLTWRFEGQPEYAVSVSGDGDLADVALKAQFTAPFRADLAGDLRELAGLWHWDGEAKVHDFDLAALGGTAALGRVTGSLELSGSAESFAAIGTVHPHGLGYGEFEAGFEGAYAARVLTAKQLWFTHKGSGAHAEGQGTVTLGAGPGGPLLALAGWWSDFRWPLDGADVAVRSGGGDFTLAGQWPYDVWLRGELEPAGVPAMPMDVSGRLARDRFVVTRGFVAPLSGMVNLTGEAAWSPAIRWSAQGRAANLDPQEMRPGWPGRLGFAFEASGTGTGEQARLALRLRDLSGRLRGQATSGGGALALDPDGWTFRGVRVGLGATRIALDGQLGESFDLDFDVAMQDLSLLSPDSRGRLEAAGTVSGRRDVPVVDARVRGAGLLHQGIGLESVDGRARIDTRPGGPMKADLALRGLAIGGRTVERATLDVDGRSNDHRIALQAEASGLELRSEARGALRDAAWTGQVTRLDLGGAKSLDLHLEHPVALAASAQSVRADPLCLAGTPARLCGEGSWTPQDWNASLEASALPLAVVMAGLAPSVDYKGAIDVKGRGFGGEGRPVQGELHATLSGAQITHRTASGRLDVIDVGSGGIEVLATPDALRARTSISAGRIGTFSGEVTADRTTPAWKDMPLHGSFRANTGELGFVTLYVPEIDRAAGRMQLDLDIGGTLGRPLVNGALRLEQGELDFFQVNLQLRRVGFEARLVDNELNFAGSTAIGAGTARVNGSLEWRNLLPYGSMHLEGENLRVADVPEAQVDASPKLDFALEGRQVRVTGEVAVPYARIAPADLSGAVLASSDEVIVGAEPEDPSKRFQVSTQVRLTLGSRVSLETFGLSGRLAGGIVARTTPADLARATGELNVEEGFYTAYGRRLEIERGRLVFTGGPIGNPGVDLRAVKVFPDVKAGINVRGTLQQPRMSFFSEPALPQSQIVSIILAGGGLATVQNNGNQPGNNTAARNELLAQGGAILAQQIGSRIGLEDVGLESNLSNETSLVLGKYLSPRLYVSYGISLAESLNTLKLRYTLGDRWTIKTEIGTARGADLVYTIDK